MAWLSRHLQRQDAHSLYLTFGALLLGLTLVVDLLFHQHMTSPWLTWGLLVVCLTGSATAFALGRRVSRWIGIGAVLLFIAASYHYMSLASDPLSVVSSIQQIPVVAFYLGWFVRPRLAVPLVVVSLTVFGAAMAGNPQLSREGAIGAPVAVHGILSLLFCYSVGFYLWRRQVRVAETDALTGAFNRHGFMERLDQRLHRLRRSPARGGFCVAAIDFDDFKRLNDAQGHAAGDRALRDTALVWRRETRVGDVIGRVGGDEFTLLLAGIDARECETVLARLRQGSEHAWSWGVAEAVPEDSPEELLERADRMLFERKRCRRGEGHG
ncbi:MAG: GGDEF domain-containing protein [Leucobacter sp.]